MCPVTWEEILKLATTIDASYAQPSASDQEQEQSLQLARLIIDFHARALGGPKVQEPEGK